jgi:hypothetical protein
LRRGSGWCSSARRSRSSNSGWRRFCCRSRRNHWRCRIINAVASIFPRQRGSSSSDASIWSHRRALGGTRDRYRPCLWLPSTVETLIAIQFRIMLSDPLRIRLLAIRAPERRSRPRTLLGQCLSIVGHSGCHLGSGGYLRGVAARLHGGRRRRVRSNRRDRRLVERRRRYRRDRVRKRGRIHQRLFRRIDRARLGRRGCANSGIRSTRCIRRKQTATWACIGRATRGDIPCRGPHRLIDSIGLLTSGCGLLALIQPALKLLGVIRTNTGSKYIRLNPSRGRLIRHLPAQPFSIRFGILEVKRPLIPVVILLKLPTQILIERIGPGFGSLSRGNGLPVLIEWLSLLLFLLAPLLFFHPAPVFFDLTLLFV